ncbi:MAG: type II CAAX prenyl endopeptidase Rce1 family protein [Planctomycetota bacterium]
MRTTHDQWWQAANPLHLPRVLAAIDRDTMAPPQERPTADRQLHIVYCCAALSLLINHYLKFRSSFRGFLELLDGWRDLPSGAHLQSLLQTGWYDLLAYCWWAGWLTVGYVLLPVLCIKLILRQRLRDYGLRLGRFGAHAPAYLLLVSPIICFALLASFREDFQEHYPFYDLAGRSWFDLLAWWCLYAWQFLCLEFFFRGFLLHAAKRSMGAQAIFVMILPYLMIHFAKPWLEATGAILFGLFLGLLSLRSGSIWGGFLVHCGIALTMDLAALYQSGAWPQRWWPA